MILNQHLGQKKVIIRNLFLASVNRNITSTSHCQIYLYKHSIHISKIYPPPLKGLILKLRHYWTLLTVLQSDRANSRSANQHSILKQTSVISKSSPLKRLASFPSLSPTNSVNAVSKQFLLSLPLDLNISITINSMQPVWALLVSEQKIMKEQNNFFYKVHTKFW